VAQGTVAGSLATVSGSYGSMNRQITFGFSTSVMIPAGGYVLAGQNGIGGFYMLKNADALFDPTCRNYSGLGGASFYTPWTYYQDHTWQLRESGEPVCEYTAPGVHDPQTGYPSGAVLCTCIGMATATPTSAASPTPTPTPTATFAVGGACPATDHLDLQITTSNAGQNPCTNNYPEFAFKIVNNGANPVDVKNLNILGWMNGTVTLGYWGGDAWRTTVYNSTGVAQGTVAGTLTTSTGTWGAMGEQITFGFASSVIIPAGGYVLAGQNGIGGWYMLKNADALFDPTCSNYSGLGGASFYTPWTYYQDPHWVLLENQSPVCEYTAPGVKDASTGIFSGGAICSCP
jgi:hypothetical protein